MLIFFADVRKRQRCVAWELSPQKEACHGYIIETTRYSDDYTHCGGINGTILNNFVETVYEAVGSEADSDGCEIKAVALGLVDSEQECELTCRNSNHHF